LLTRVEIVIRSRPGLTVDFTEGSVTVGIGDGSGVVC
jgi:hypothetical protein